jgi:hypothetical protein
MAKEDDKKEKSSGNFLQIVVSAIVAAVIISMLIFIFISEPPGTIKLEPTGPVQYKAMYTADCSKPDEYFYNISRMVYGKTNKSYVLELKEQLDYCTFSEKQEIDQDAFEDLYCDCVEWKGERFCMPGFILNGSYCLDLPKARYSVPMVNCSRFMCKNGEIVEILTRESEN